LEFLIAEDYAGNNQELEYNLVLDGYGTLTNYHAISPKLVIGD